MADGVQGGFWLRALKAECPEGDVYKLALFPDELDLDAQYDARIEMEGVGYTEGGATLTGYAVEQDGAEAVLKFDRFVTWTGADVKARSAMIYNATTGNAIRIIDFGRIVGVTGGLFDVTLAEEGVLRLGPQDRANNG